MWPVTGEFPAQRATNAENVSIWLRHHDIPIIMHMVCSLCLCSGHLPSCNAHPIPWDVLYIWVCQTQVSRVGTSNYIPQNLWGVITCPCPWYLFLAQHPSYLSINSSVDRFNIKTQFYHLKDKTAVRPFYHYNGNSYTAETSLYWIDC